MDFLHWKFFLPMAYEQAPTHLGSFYANNSANHRSISFVHFAMNSREHDLRDTSPWAPSFMHTVWPHNKV